MKRKIDFHYSENLDGKYVLWYDSQYNKSLITFFAIRPVVFKGKTRRCSNLYKDALLFDTKDSAEIYLDVLGEEWKKLFKITTVKEMIETKTSEYPI